MRKSDDVAPSPSLALTGTWCTPEIELALKHGYTVTAVYEVHHFEHKTKDGEGLMQAYVKEFLKGKQESSGWPRANMSQEDKDDYIDDYMFGAAFAGSARCLASVTASKSSLAAASWQRTWAVELLTRRSGGC